MFSRLAVLSVFLWFFVGTARAQPTVDLYAVRAQVEAVNDLAAGGIITEAQAKQGVEGILGRAESAIGKPVTLAELAAVQGPTPVSAELTWLQRAAGFVTFTNTMIAIAAFIFTAALLYLCGRGIVTLLAVFTLIPAIVYESLLVVSGLGLTAFGTTLSAANASTAGLVGALLYGGGFVWIVGRHGARISASTVSLILAVAWGVSAVLFDSQLIGALSVMALMSSLGFAAFMLPGIVMIGFKDEDRLVRSTISAFTILGLFVGLEIFGGGLAFLASFRGGALYVGGFVGYLGALIVGTRWYATEASYLARQIPMFVAGIGALYLGSVYGIPELQKMGGTFFVLYLLEKPLEIPTRDKLAYAFVVLVFSAVTIGGFLWANNNPDVVAPYLFFV